MTEPTSAQELFKGRHFDQEIIVLCVRWYLTFKLSSRDLVQMMAERGITLTHTTILRWVQRYVTEFDKRWSWYARRVGDSWRVDETYLKIKGQWVYLYRAVDKAGRPAVLFPSDETAWRPKGDHLGRLRRLRIGRSLN
jgi:transposase-like protein